MQETSSALAEEYLAVYPPEVLLLSVSSTNCKSTGKAEVSKFIDSKELKKNKSNKKF